MVLLNDITSLVKAESLKASERSRDLIVATTSHELRTPLNSIIGMLSLMEHHIISKEGIEYLKIANSSSELMLSLVHDILDYS
jgi:two-component system sensor histidine kinase EvgS